MADVSRLQPTPSQIPSKGAKEEKLTLPLPVQIFAGQALGVIGQSLFSEKVIKPVSLLGYYGSRTVERTGQLLEGVIDFVINDAVAGLAADEEQIMLEEINEGYARLKADTKAWKEELQEREELEGTRCLKALLGF